MSQRGFGVIELILIGLATGMLTYGTVRAVEAVEGRSNDQERVVIKDIKITPSKPALKDI